MLSFEALELLKYPPFSNPKSPSVNLLRPIKMIYTPTL